jgi:hypothetical protein
VSDRSYTNAFVGTSAFLLLVITYLAATSEPPTIEYTELDIIMDTPKSLYVVGEAINATVYLQNQRPVTVYVKPFDTSFMGYPYGEVPPVSLGHSFGGPPIEVPGNSTYKVVSKVFHAERMGFYFLDFNGFTKTVQVVDAPDSSLWDRPLEVLESQQFEHKSPSLDLSHWFAVVSKVSSMNRTGRPSWLPLALVQLYPDWINGTAYVTMTSITDEYTRPILEEFSPETQRYIRFLKAPAPLIQIRAWEKRILAQQDALKKHGVMISTLSIHFDGRILLGIEDIGEEKIKALCETLKDVPLGVIVVYKVGPIVLE